MLAELEALQTQTRMAAREKFIAAAWRQRPAEELLALAVKKLLDHTRMLRCTKL